MSFLPRVDADDDDEAVVSERTGFLEHAFKEPLPPGKDFLVVALPAAIEAPEKFLRMASDGTSSFLWRAAGSPSIAGVGAAATVTGCGPDRFEQFRRGLADLWPRVLVRAPDGTKIIPVAVGGMSFVPGVPLVAPWSEFDKDGFTLAKWAYRREGDTAHLLVTATREELADPEKSAALVAQTYRYLVELSRESATSMIERVELTKDAVHHSSLGEWMTYIGEIKKALASGKFTKIVAARRSVIDLPKRMEVTGFMARLFASYPDCTHFAIRRGHATFLGATPETLIRKRGQTVTTHALAGTIRVTDDIAADTTRDAEILMQNPKTQVEHSLVTQKICEDLYPLAKKLRYSSQPSTRRLRHLIHLQTPITCELHDTVDAFDLVRILHPTPAVGGFPTREAASWIVDNEPIERGWFTGTVGWVDAEGNAHFAVAIRCGILTDRRAYLYAGAGIVMDSDAEDEYKETAGKMVPLLRALGLTSA